MGFMLDWVGKKSTGHWKPFLQGTTINDLGRCGERNRNEIVILVNGLKNFCWIFFRVPLNFSCFRQPVIEILICTPRWLMVGPLCHIVTTHRFSASCIVGGRYQKVTLNSEQFTILLTWKQFSYSGRIGGFSVLPTFVCECVHSSASGIL